MSASHKLKTLALGLAVMAGFALPNSALAQRRFFGGNGISGPAGSVSLPYSLLQGANMQWTVYAGGWFQNQGNMPVYGQAAMLLINGQQIGQNGPVRIDDKTGELVLEIGNFGGCTITRRLLANKDEGYVRYIDVIKNTQAAAQVVSVTLQSNLNYGVQNSQMIPDPKKKDLQLGWVAQTGGGQAAVEIFNGHGAKNALSINVQQGSNLVQASISLAIPAGHEMALLHIHSSAGSPDAGSAFISKFNERQMLKSIPAPLRKLIVNYHTVSDALADMNLLRGDLLDVVELQSGDQFRGTLKETSYDLQTSYGPVSVPVDKVIALLSSGQFRPRQLVVTSDGQIIGGTFKKQTIDLQLSSGQVTQIPLGQVARVGYRKRVGEPESLSLDGKSLVMMRSGDRVSTQLPAEPIGFVTRFGKLSLKAEQIDQVILQQEDHLSHQMVLVDGSRFTGLLDAEQFSLKLDGPGNQVAKFPVSGISRLQFAGKTAELEDFTPTIKLGDDVLVGGFVGQIKLDTAFDTITVNASEVRTLTHAGKGPADVKLTLWDGTTLSGEVEDPTLSCQLQSGAAIQLPVGMVDEYNQPQPQPAADMLQKIKTIITDLNNDNWKQRDRAQAELTSMGPVAISTLRQLRPGQPPEAQKNIDLILKELEKQAQQGPSSGPKPESAVPAN